MWKLKKGAVKRLPVSHMCCSTASKAGSDEDCVGDSVYRTVKTLLSDIMPVNTGFA